MRSWTLAGLWLLGAAGCDGPRTCETAPQQIFCDRPEGASTTFITETHYIPDRWLPEVSADWGCDFELDGGVATYVPRGELCTSRPLNDTSDDVRLLRRRCQLPEGDWVVIGPENRLSVKVSDAGVSCTAW